MDTRKPWTRLSSFFFFGPHSGFYPDRHLILISCKNGVLSLLCHFFATTGHFRSGSGSTQEPGSFSDVNMSRVGSKCAGTPELSPLATTPLAVPVHVAPVFHFECMKWKGEELECGEMDEEKVTQRWRQGRKRDGVTVKD